MNKFFRYLLYALSVVIISFSLLFLSTRVNIFNGFSVVTNGLSTVHRFVGWPFQSLTRQKNIVEDLFASYDENSDLKSSIMALGNVQSQNESLVKENENLRKNLAMKEEYSSLDFTAAMVVSRSPMAWNQTLTVDMGENDGITLNSLVLSNNGLIGFVSDMTSTSSVVSLFTNDSFELKVPVKIIMGSDSVYGILSGYDVESNSFIISQLNEEREIKVGSQVVTSDFGGTVPANLPVGKVRSVQENASSSEKSVFVSPAADFSNLYSVLMVGK
ncbi:rod shape-determining protein MreC [Streptococcus suis]|uniref:rod shape-determining protein MreC n=1 Tax=Streptococcus suis TaxID=1307 RepID=UPI00147894FD